MMLISQISRWAKDSGKWSLSGKERPLALMEGPGLEQGSPASLVPDDLRWSLCSDNGNKVCSKCNVPDSY